eukprot:gene578-10266_t
MEDKGKSVEGNKNNITTVEEKLRLCRRELKGYPELISRSFVNVDKSNRESADEGRTNNCFKVMQYNILADALGTGAGNFEKVPKDCLPWSFRKHRIIEQILHLDPDVVCLEEVDHFHDVFQPLFEELDFSGFFFPKKDSPCLRTPDNNGPDGVAIFYRKSKFSLIEIDSRYLNNTEKQPSNQPVLICMLQSKQSEKCVCFAATHFKAKKGFEELRAVQAKSCLHFIEEFRKKVSPESAVILCGDFNGAPSEKFYEILENHCGKYLQSAYKEANGKELTYTTWKIRQDNETKHTIDYIWFSHEQLKVVSFLDLPVEDDVPESRFPSFSCPSDHLPLCCEFSFKD